MESDMEQLSPAVAVDTGAHYVDWGAIIAGAVLASGIALLLFTFGTAIGLSMVSPYEGEGTSRTAYFIVLGLWSTWVIVSSFLAGGYLAGRLRRRIGDGTPHEIEVRDGAHGIVVWAVGVVVGSLLLTYGVSSVAGNAAATGMIERRTDMTLYTVDALLRGAGESTATLTNDAERNEISRLLTYGVVRGELNAQDKMYLSHIVANRTGLATAAAERRVEQVLADAQYKADIARKGGIIIGFLTVAALLIGGAAAAWSATLGGRHRDEGTDTAFFWRWG
jgi:hypothetical protein